MEDGKASDHGRNSGVPIVQPRLCDFSLYKGLIANTSSRILLSSNPTQDNSSTTEPHGKRIQKPSLTHPGREILEHEIEHSPGQEFFTIITDPDPDSDPESDHAIKVDESVSVWVDCDATDSIDPERACVFSMPSSVDSDDDSPSDKLVSCILVALGTDPVSVWLMYHYHIQEYCEVVNRWTNRLGEYQYQVFRSVEPKFASEIQDEFAELGDSSSYGNQYQDFRKLYTNEENMRPRRSKESFNQTEPLTQKVAHKHKLAFSDDESPSNSSDTSASSSSKITDHERVDFKLTANHESPPSSVHGNDDVSGDNHTSNDGGVDLALLAPDITVWHGIDSLDRKQVKVYLDSSHMWLDSSRRARTSTNEEKELFFKGKCIDIRALRFG
ncbi:MAG: hypothetical protein Q9201_001030 [Fulgogasparrea decipioides]